MKRWIHGASYSDLSMKKNTISNQAKKIHDAKDELAQYSKEKVDYVRKCQEDLTKAISDYYTEGKDEQDYNIGSELSQIKRDWLIGAIEDDLMTEEEFEDILALIDAVDLELAAPYA